MSCEYTPRTATGTVFYIDVYSGDAVSAAVCEMRYDSGVAEHRSVTAAANTSSVRCRSEDGLVRIAFADSGAVKGHLFRVSFQARSAGECDFVLHAVQAIDGDLRYIKGLPDYTLTVTLSEKDASSSAASGSAKRTEKASSSVSGSSDKSSKVQYPARDVTAAETPVQTAVDLRDGEQWTYFAFGAGAVLLTAALVLLGYLIGRKVRMKPQAEQPDRTGPEDRESPSADVDEQ